MSKKKVAVNLKRLIEILGMHLYSEAEICIRELIQNAHDSLLTRSKQYPGIKKTTRIDIRTNKADGTLSFTDTGIGMSADEIDLRLARIANSAKDELRKQFSSTSTETDSNLVVGSFGIGFLSSFLVANRVTVKTRKAESQENAVIWSSVGDEFYETCDSTSTQDFFGTEVTLELKESFRHFLNGEWIARTVIKFCDFITYPIYFNDEPTPINMRLPPWRDCEAVDEDYLGYLKRRHGALSFVGCIPIQWDGIVGGIVGIPEEPLNQEQGISLHHDRFFVSETKNLLPLSLSFLVGIIDTTGLSLLLNREAFINDASAVRLKRHFTLKIAQGLKLLARDKKRSFDNVVKIWGDRLKWAAVESDAIFEQIGEFMQLSVCGEQLSMTTILDRYDKAGDTKRFIYMDNEPTQRQYMSMLSQFGFPVVETESDIDYEFLYKYARRRHINMETADKSIGSLIEPIENNAWDGVIREISAYVDSSNTGQITAIQAAEFKMEDVPALISTRQETHENFIPPSRMEQLPKDVREILQKLQKTDRVLFLNVSHPLVLELRNLVDSTAKVSANHIKTKIILMRGLLNAAAIHSGNFKPTALNQLLQEMASALLFVAEQQIYISDLENRISADKQKGSF